MHGPWALVDDLLLARRGMTGAETTFPIIWPMTPSARIMAGVRYLNDRSNPRPAKVGHLLNGVKCEDLPVVVVAAAAAAPGLKIVGLRGWMFCETGPPRTLTMRRGELGRGYVAYAFLFEILTPGEDDDVITALPRMKAPP